MSTLKNPVGPRSSRVYWRRRLVVGLALLAVIIVVILLIVRPGSSAGTPNTSASQSASDQPTDASTTPADSTTIPTDAASADGKACKPANIAVVASTDKTGYDAGEIPQLSVSVSNTGSKDCVFNVGSAKQVYTISSGDEVYWTSTDCQTDAVDADVTLKPETPMGSAAPLTWDRTRSSKDTCDGTRDAAPAGGASYHLTVEVNGVKSEPVQFLLY